MYIIFPIILSIAVFGGPLTAYAEEINVISYSLEDTTIIVIENNSKDEINTFRMWLGSNESFESFKVQLSAQ